MANQIQNTIRQFWEPTVQDFLNNNLVAKSIANMEFREALASGNTVNFPQTSDARVQDYTDGTDAIIDPVLALQSSLVINQSKMSTFSLTDIEQRQVTSKYWAKQAKQTAFQLANNIDQNVISTGINNAASSITGGTLASNTIYQIYTQARAQLERNNADDRPLFSLIDPNTMSLLSQNFVANGFNKADAALEYGFRGLCDDTRVYKTNNLPYSVLLTMGTIPTAGDEVRLYGFTWTFVALGTAANPGEISLGANATASFTNFRDAVNGTGTPGAGTYIDLTTVATIQYRRTLQNGQVNVGAGATAATITGFGTIQGSLPTNVAVNTGFGQETSNLLFGSQDAISLGMQINPTLTVTQEPRQTTKNYLTQALWGSAVFSRDTFRLVKVPFNVPFYG